mgnify:CR=1 FL=1
MAWCAASDPYGILIMPLPWAVTPTANYFAIQFTTTIPLSLPMCLTFSVTITMLFMIAVVPIIMSASSISKLDRF